MDAIDNSVDDDFHDEDDYDFFLPDDTFAAARTSSSTTAETESSGGLRGGIGTESQESETEVGDGQDNVRRKAKKANDKRKKKRKVGPVQMASSGRGSARQKTYDPSRVFVTYKDNVGKLDAQKAAKEIVLELPETNTMVITVDDDMKEMLEKDDAIETVETDHKLEAYQSDVEFVEEIRVPRSLSGAEATREARKLAERGSWGIDMIESAKVPMGDYPVKVCVIDTGYASGHPDLPEASGTDSIRNGRREPWRWDMDFNGHGTHVAGIISAIGGNDIGVAGIGAIPLHITRGLDDNSDGFESDILIALQQCITAGAKVVNLSLGGSQTSEVARTRFTEAVHRHGMLVVAAAGNQGQNTYAYPASNGAVISVGAVYDWGSYWEGSNYNDQLELAAPGFGILSTSTTRSAVHTQDFSFSATQLTGSRHDQVAGKLVDCGPTRFPCTAAFYGICLISKDQQTLRTVINNCRRGGGVGAIIFDANGGEISDVGLRTYLPTVFVTTEMGQRLEAYVGQRVEIGHADSDAPEYTYAVYRGTSMATPHVSAAAANVWSNFPNCTNAQIRYALAATAADQGLEGCDWDYGYGIVNASAAYDFILERDGCNGESFGDLYTLGGCKVTD